jgi:hypothetical protein
VDEVLDELVKLDINPVEYKLNVWLNNWPDTLDDLRDRLRDTLKDTVKFVSAWKLVTGNKTEVVNEAGVENKELDKLDEETADDEIEMTKELDEVRLDNRLDVAVLRLADEEADPETLELDEIIPEDILGE